MRKFLITTILVGMLASCSSDDEAPQNVASVTGKTFLRSSFIIDTPVDANGDGVYSNDLMQEILCFDLNLSFDEEFRVSNPSFDAVSLYVNDDGNGNLSQSMNCSHGDGLPSLYRQINNTINFLGFNDQELEFTGTLSDDETTITIEFSNEFLFGFNFFPNGDKILLQDGTILDYEGGATVIYTLHE